MSRFSSNFVAPYRIAALLAISIALGMGPVFAEKPAQHTSQASGSGGFIDGVLAYRQGQYTLAEQIFLPLHDQAPDQSRITYYLALIKEQLGDFNAAKALFEEVITLDPNSEAARMSHIALQQFPAADQAALKQTGSADGFQLDPPPNLTALSAPLAPSQTLPPMPSTATVNNNTGQNSNFSPQDLMMMQMMMGGMNNNNNSGGSNGLNPMMLQGMMNQGQGNGQQGTNLDPNIMSTMMMNQMLQNFNMDFKGNNNDQ